MGGNYPPGVWEVLEALPEGSTHGLPGQLSSAALALRQKALPYLQEFGLGELRHIVALAIGHRLLVYNGHRLSRAGVGDLTFQFHCRRPRKGTKNGAGPPGTVVAMPPDEHNVEHAEGTIRDHLVQRLGEEVDMGVQASEPEYRRRNWGPRLREGWRRRR